MAIGKEEDVLRFQVAMNDVLAVDVCEGCCGLQGIEFGLLIGELACTAQMCKELPTVDRFHDDVNEVFIFAIALTGHNWTLRNTWQKYMVETACQLLST